MKILIADDNKQNRYLFETILKSGGHEVISAENGKTALALLQEKPVDLIVSDVLMPVMDGFRLCIKCKSDEKLKQLPLILITSNYTGKKDEEFALKLGADKFLVRPIEPDKFPQIIKEVTDKAKSQGVSVNRGLDENTVEFLRMYNERVVDQLDKKLMELEQDISERKQAEEALRETNQYLENLLDYANAPIIVWDPQFVITRFNHAFESLTGRSANDVIGKPLEILFPPDLVESSMKLIRKTQSGERMETVEIGIQHLNGSIRTVLWNSSTLFAMDGKSMVATIAQGQDITKRKRAEETLEESEKKFRDMVETSPLAIYISTGIEQKAHYINPRFVQLFGYTIEDVPTVGHWWPRAYPDEKYRQQIIEEWQDKIKRSIETKTPIEPMDVTVTCKDGSTKNLIWGFTSLGDTNFAFGLDITERKRAEEALARRMDELAQFNAAAVDRELRMVELKEQVNELARQLSQPPPYQMESLNEAVPASAPRAESEITGNPKSQSTNPGGDA